MNKILIFPWFWITFPKNLTNAIWPNVHSTESPFNRTPFDRKFILPKGHMTDFFFFFFQKMVIWPNRLSTKNVIWPKIQLTESSYNRKLFLKMIIWSNRYLTEGSFDQKLFSKNGHLTECFFFEKLSFSKNCHLTDWSYFIRIVHVPNFFVARRRERKNCSYIVIIIIPIV
jgi:hypothetical protein